ncbi:formate dehydrogenase subunit alpha [Candidatus Izimaplasma bacterium]|nr:formate dehydrogenase subunit alpha [Candidatus Izimaplasma bacterium]
MNKITINLNGRELLVEENKSILEVAQNEGILIPTFCHDERLKADAGCRVCVVEIEGNNKLQTSCSTKVTPGMIIKTNTEKVQKARDEVIELMWSSHPNDCVVCDANEDCKLQDYMYLYDIKSDNKYDGHQRNFEIDYANKFFYIDPDKCILCGKCVRVCSELQGVEALGFNKRGHETFISFSYDKGMDFSNCVSCGNCVSSCPTGALMEKSRNKFRMHETTKTTTTCPYCGVGCQFNLVVKDNKVVKVEPINAIPNEGLLCVKGKFAYKYINHPDRLTTPLIKENGIFVEASWEEAYKLIHSKFKGYTTEFGKNSVAGLASAKCTNEENYLFQKFMRKDIGTNNVDHCARLCHASTVSGLATTLGSGAMTNSIAEVKNNDVIFVIGSNTTETHPVIGSFMKQAQQRGAKIIVAEPRKIELAEFADVFIMIKPGTNVALLNAMMKVIYDEGLHNKEFIEKHTENYDKFIEVIKEFDVAEGAKICGCNPEDIKKAARIYASSNNSGIYYAMGITQHSNGTNHVKSIANLALLTGNVGKENAGINPLRGQNNVQGACDMGALPNNYPGYQKIYNKEVQSTFEKAWGTKLDNNVGLSLPHMINGAHNGTIKMLYVMGENPMVSDPDTNHVRESLKRVDFLVVQDIFMTETAEFADVILPASTYAEKDGTFTNTERRVQRVRKAVEPIGTSKSDGLIIQELMQYFDKDYTIKSPKEIMDEVSLITPIYHGIDYDRIDDLGLQWPVKDKNHPGTKFLYEHGFTRGKGHFTPVTYKGAAELPDKEYPLTLTTGRVLYHFHSKTMTGKNEEINEIVPVNFIEINPKTAKIYKINDLESVIVTSRRGETKAEVHITDNIGVDTIFMPFHFADGANVLTNTALDETCNIPELKVCAVEISKI